MTRRRAILGPLLLLLALASACGGIVEGGAQDGSAEAGAGSDAGDELTSACQAQGGLMLCGGQCGATCPVQPDGKGCASDLQNPQPSNQLGICATKSSELTLDCQECSDGHVCALDSERWLQSTPEVTFGFMGCGPIGYAQMYAANGRSDLARYADRSAFTSAPLPAPSTCPSVPGLTLCGGACGSCPTGYVCTGRSPLHPYSLCVNEWSIGNGVCQRAKPGCMDGTTKYRCLTFKVDDPSQSVADQYSICVDRSICEAAAQSYPGGAYCSGGA